MNRKLRCSRRQAKKIFSKVAIEIPSRYPASICRLTTRELAYIDSWNRKWYDYFEDRYLRQTRREPAVLCFDKIGVELLNRHIQAMNELCGIARLEHTNQRSWVCGEEIT